MPRPVIILTILGFVALLIVALAVFFVMNISRIGLLESGILAGVGIAGLLIILVVLFLVMRVIVKKK